MREQSRALTSTRALVWVPPRHAELLSDSENVVSSRAILNHGRDYDFISSETRPDESCELYFRLGG